MPAIFGRLTVRPCLLPTERAAHGIGTPITLYHGTHRRVAMGCSVRAKPAARRRQLAGGAIRFTLDIAASTARAIIADAIMFTPADAVVHRLLPAFSAVDQTKPAVVRQRGHVLRVVPAAAAQH